MPYVNELNSSFMCFCRSRTYVQILCVYVLCTVYIVHGRNKGESESCWPIYRLENKWKKKPIGISLLRNICFIMHSKYMNAFRPTNQPTINKTKCFLCFAFIFGVQHQTIHWMNIEYWILRQHFFSFLSLLLSVRWFQLKWAIYLKLDRNRVNI